MASLVGRQIGDLQRQFGPGLRLPLPPDEVSLVNWEAGGLLKPSVVEPIPILSSFDVRLVRRKLGAPSASDLAQRSNRASTSLDREFPACRLHKLC